MDLKIYQISPKKLHNCHHTSFQDFLTSRIFQLKDASKWQPAIFGIRTGVFAVQQFVTPQNGQVRPYTFTNVNDFEVEPHGRLLNSEVKG